MTRRLVCFQQLEVFSLLFLAVSKSSNNSFGYIYYRYKHVFLFTSRTVCWALLHVLRTLWFTTTPYMSRMQTYVFVYL